MQSAGAEQIRKALAAAGISPEIIEKAITRAGCGIWVCNVMSPEEEAPPQTK